MTTSRQFFFKKYCQDLRLRQANAQIEPRGPLTTMSDPDAASAALIAKLLQEENPYGEDVYGYQDDSDDCDYGRKRKKKKKKPAAKPVKAPKEPKPPKEPKAPKEPKRPREPTGDEEFTETGRRKRKDAGKERAKARAWDEQEEVKFREALVLHGRDWKKCAEHVGTRDARSFTSHAQKYFIKLCLQGKPLPAKVRETGDGYTLSGKPLDPNSSAAKQYGFKTDTSFAMPDGSTPAGLMSTEDAQEAEKARQAKVAEMVGKLPLDTDGRFKVGTVLRKKLDLEEIERDENADANSCEPTQAQGLGLVPQTAKTRDTPTDDKTAEKWIEGKIADVDKDDADNPLPYSVKFADGTFEDLSHEELEVWVEAHLKHKKTEERRVWDEEQERKRSEREAKFADKTQKAAEKAAEKEAKQLAKVREARDKAAAEAAAAEPTEYARSRPRRETVAVGATTFRDAGGGTLELHPMRKFSPSPPGSGVPGAQPFKLTVSPAAMLVMDLHAHLCTNEVIGYLGGSWDPHTRSLTIDRAFPGRGVASGMDVEMDPIAEVELKSQVEAQNMKVVGWYHSHPVFKPTPSGVDINNQLNYQRLFRDETVGVEPFVGFIVGPYDMRLPNQVSSVTAFCAQRMTKAGATEDIPFEVSYGLSEDKDVEPLTVGTMAAVVVQNKSTEGRVNPTELWRPFTTFENFKPSGGPCTKLAKLRASLCARLPAGMSELREEEIMDGVAKTIQTSWGLDLGY